MKPNVSRSQSQSSVTGSKIRQQKTGGFRLRAKTTVSSSSDEDDDETSSGGLLSSASPSNQDSVDTQRLHPNKTKMRVSIILCIIFLLIIIKEWLWLLLFDYFKLLITKNYEYLFIKKIIILWSEELSVHPICKSKQKKFKCNLIQTN